jgi:Protein-glutamine gamma-glutamyltransferase
VSNDRTRRPNFGHHIHPDSPAFPAGAGGFRQHRVQGGFLDRSPGALVQGAPAARHAVWARRQQREGAARSGQRVFKQLSYPELLDEGATKLKSVKFGNALKSFAANLPKEMFTFDSSRWDVASFVSPGETTAEMLLVAKSESLGAKPLSPAEAILEVFRSPELWSFDCAQFVQVVLLYAVINSITPEKFNERVRANVLSSGKMLLRAHASTGLKVTGGSQIRKPEVANLTQNLFLEKKSAQEAKFKAAPIGSQIIFTNRDARANNKAYEHENTIKLGDDQFLAHGIVRGDHRVTRAQIYSILAEDALRGTGQKGDEVYEKRNLYISLVELFGDK